MAQALQLAEQGLYTTTPNPRVGCVLVRKGELVGQGWHQSAGTAHAEVHALNAAQSAARGATAYVTLEPCSHFGRTPPCADALIAAGVARVVVAMEDPNPQVAGQGVARLRAAGIAVEHGLMETAARELNIGFWTRMTSGLPWVRCKIAASLDGRTALANGVSQWITGAAARHDVQHWRARSCAVLTGIGTVLADDPRLDVRELETPRQPLRVIFDSRLQFPPAARMLQGDRNIQVYTALQDAQKIAALESAGARVTVLPDNNGQVDLQAALRHLAASGCNEVLVEAGSILNGALLRAGLINEMLLYVSPQLLGEGARGLVQLGELTALDQRVELQWQDVRNVGRDIRIIARVQKAGMGQKAGIAQKDKNV
jgi:diaminohydroxyphosphoribosylaminopyrimidine deaminase/5-amino-6-(5-phosphoribosylamino)uracil reductase